MKNFRAALMIAIVLTTALALALSLSHSINDAPVEQEPQIPSSALYSHFFSATEGIALCSDYAAMGAYAMQVFETQDGGQTWRLKTDNEDGYIVVSYNAQYLFIDSATGFIFDPFRGEADARLLMTTDGGATFYTIEFVDDAPISPAGSPLQLPKNIVYDYYELPTYADGVLTVIVSQGYDGDFNGGNTVLEYQSTDLGKSWHFVAEYVR